MKYQIQISSKKNVGSNHFEEFKSFLKAREISYISSLFISFFIGLLRVCNWDLKVITYMFHSQFKYNNKKPVERVCGCV